MKKIFITAAVLMATLSMGARVFTTGEARLVSGVEVDKPVISADGEFVVAQGIDGIQRVDLADGTSRNVVKGEGLHNIVINGNTIAYVRPSFDANHLRYMSLETADMTTGETQVVVKPSRDMALGVTLTDEGVTAINKRRAAARGRQAPVAGIYQGHLTLTANGKTVYLDPQGRGSYLWPSISPDGTKIVYWLAYRGCFVCDLDGSNPRHMGGLRAAVWAGNDAIVGMETENGQAQIPTASRIVAVDINTAERQTLTDDSVLAQFPSVNATATRMAYTDPAGKLYIMDLNR